MSQPDIKDRLYAVLGVKKGATDREVRQAYLRLSRKYHPDRGGDPAMFKELGLAKEVLSDPRKRQLYDSGGLDAVEKGFNPQEGAGSIFESLFRSGGSGAPAGPRKAKPTVQPITLSLEELYLGCRKKFRIRRKRVKVPEGITLESATTPCAQCSGRGWSVKQMEISPGRLVQAQQSCETCAGRGMGIVDGVEVVSESTVIEVVVEVGSTHGQKIQFDGEGDEEPGLPAGDIIFVIQEKPHETFKRKGADLLLQKTITLADALCGVRFTQKTLDGRSLRVETPSGKAVRHGDILALQGEGMPQHGCPFDKGRLFVVFEVDMPSPAAMSAELRSKLEELLPGRTPAMDAGCKEARDAEPAILAPVDADSFGQTRRAEAGAGAAYDSDGEEGGGQQRVQCAQQ